MMEDSRKAKKYLLTGAIIGGILSLSIALLMDTFYADSFQGTWRDAIAKDLNTFFSLDVTSKSILVNIVFIFVLGILSAFGAFMGFIFSFFLYKFFSFLSDK
ncbi:MAG: hypothetical protein AB1632_05710 [Nitrospirota bacterium]